MHLEGDRDIPLPIDQAWPRLSDAGFLAGSLKGVEIIRTGPDESAWKLRPALSFITGSLDITLTIVERTPPSTVTARVFSKGIGATSTVEVRVGLLPSATGCTASWTLDVTQLTGLLKLVPKGLMQGAAQKVIDDVWNQIAAAMNNEQ